MQKQVGLVVVVVLLLAVVILSATPQIVDAGVAVSTAPEPAPAQDDGLYGNWLIVSSLVGAIVGTAWLLKLKYPDP